MKVDKTALDFYHIHKVVYCDEVYNKTMKVKKICIVAFGCDYTQVIGKDIYLN
ncbi:MAG: hypothetical protein ACOC3V_03345 [bacterium]